MRQKFQQVAESGKFSSPLTITKVEEAQPIN